MRVGGQEAADGHGRRAAGLQVFGSPQCAHAERIRDAKDELGRRSVLRSSGHLGKIACMMGGSFKWDPKKEEITDNEALNGLITRRYRGDWSLDA